MGRSWAGKPKPVVVCNVRPARVVRRRAHRIYTNFSDETRLREPRRLLDAHLRLLCHVSSPLIYPALSPVIISTPERAGLH